MILFWIIAGILTLAAAVVLAAPLFDTRKFKSEDAYALAVYRDQLSELSRDERRGLLTPEQARAAQVEIERRILALDEGKKFLPAKPPGHHLTLAMAVILPLLGFGFYLLGTVLERADMSARILDVKYHLLLPDVSMVGSPLDYYQWAALLKSLSGFEAYRRRYHAGLRPVDVAEFAIFEPDFPRSLRFCVEQMEEALGEIVANRQGAAAPAIAGGSQ